MITEAKCEICCSQCTGGGHSARSLRSILQGVLEDSLDSWMESRWLWISRIKYINIKEALWKISRSSVHWKKKLFYESPEHPPRSLGGHSLFLNGVRQLWRSRMTYINIKEALCKISYPYVHWKKTFFIKIPECPPRSLRGHSWFLNGV